MQNAFLGGRFMSDNINLVQELLRQYGRKKLSPHCLLKVDFKKAFDSVQWGFIENLLCHLGFPAKFFTLVMQCVSTVSFFVAVNGDIHCFFLGNNGVRQGDPLSPYIFICCMKYFSRMLKLASQQEGFRFHPKCKLHGISHLAFAYDFLLLSRGDSSSVQCLLRQLSLFGKTSGLDINPQKSRCSKASNSLYVGLQRRQLPFHISWGPSESPQAASQPVLASSTGFEVVSPRLDWQISYICWAFRTPSVCSVWESSILAKYISHP